MPQLPAVRCNISSASILLDCSPDVTRPGGPVDAGQAAARTVAVTGQQLPLRPSQTHLYNIHIAVLCDPPHLVQLDPELRRVVLGRLEEAQRQLGLAGMDRGQEEGWGRRAGRARRLGLRGGYLRLVTSCCSNVEMRFQFHLRRGQSHSVFNTPQQIFLNECKEIKGQ